MIVCSHAVLIAVHAVEFIARWFDVNHLSAKRAQSVAASFSAFLRTVLCFRAVGSHLKLLPACFALPHDPALPIHRSERIPICLHAIVVLRAQAPDVPGGCTAFDAAPIFHCSIVEGTGKVGSSNWSQEMMFNKKEISESISPMCTISGWTSHNLCSLFFASSGSILRWFFIAAKFGRKDRCALQKRAMSRVQKSNLSS